MSTKTDNWQEALVEKLARELYDGFIMGGWDPQDAYPILREAIRRTLEQAAKRRDWTPEEVAAALRQLMEPGK